MTGIPLADASHGVSLWPLLLAGGVALAVVVLTVEHTVVKHGRLRLRHFRGPTGALLALAMVAIGVPALVEAQQPTEPSGLPDLISDPPFIWFTNDVTTPAGEDLRVLAFDGYIHNIGAGSLEVAGNPQLEGGMKQRVFNGNEWEEIGNPTVKFETDDGHNHFHLMEVIDYQLWNEGRTSVIGDASKVGFCLIDTEQLEFGVEALYDIDASNYCESDNPDATDLTMGISPGWRDTYEATVTFQWVNVSNVTPGRYWVSALTDPNNEIFESSEENNDIVFSSNKFAIDGYVARELPVQAPSEPIMLKANRYGVVGDLAFVIAEGPTNGSLDVPVGVDLDRPLVTYVPSNGFVGTDSFTYFANNVALGYPYDPVMVTVEIDVPEGATTAEPVTETTGDVTLELPAEISTAEEVSIQVTADGFDADGAVWHAGELPPGLQIDAVTGVISGVPTLAGDYNATITAMIDDRVIRSAVSLAVVDAGVITMQPINDFSTTQTRKLSLWLGRGTADASYEGSGLPKGASVTSNIPLISGTPEELGVFDIELREIIDGEVSQTLEFTWTVTPAARPVFPL